MYLVFIQFPQVFIETYAIRAILIFSGGKLILLLLHSTENQIKISY